MRKSLFLALRGMAMGMAEVVPGVSGGTIAFITGIYAELLSTIKELTPAKLKVLKNEGFVAFWKAINGSFLMALFAGMAAGLVFGVLTIAKLLEHYPILVWAFFFGLILASVIHVARQIKKWTWIEILFLIIGAAVSYYITIAAPTQGPQELWFVFIAGFIAICALMLPGVSGSFLLLLMGMYQFIVTKHVKLLISDFNTESLLIVAVFGIGCLAGVLTFSRVLTWTFNKYYHPTLAVLTGFLIGSLNKVWPWKHVTEVFIKHPGEADQEIVPMLEQSVLPQNFDQYILNGNQIVGYEAAPNYLWGAILMMLIGFFLIIAMEFLSKEKA